MRITLVISSLGCGGAERVMSNIANYWTAKGWSITLITLATMDSDFYHLETNVRRISLDRLGDSSTVIAALKNNIVRLSELRKSIKKSKPHVVISFIDRMNVLTLVSTLGIAIPVVVCEHTDPRQSPPGGIWNLLRRKTYKWASAVVVLTSEVICELEEFVLKKRIHVIPNSALPVPKVDNPIPFRIPTPSVIAMGRLVKLKGFDLLLEAFAKCNKKQWSLMILGEGPEREHLHSIIEQFSLNSQVYLVGRVPEPKIYLQQADLFVLSSHYEGFPMAIIEAMSCGLPIVSFDCPTGPRDIIRNGIDGLLVPAEDVDSLAKAMNRLMENARERKTMGKFALQVVERFSESSIMKKWEKLIVDVTC
jgi:GalNAc-alpha-(1->4)-GalNAc-alpha-(1->3)-diNAcBac-PP-undecaprenol alpha-1,4-N-acetyl-D-galactosaminyltransferase